MTYEQEEKLKTIRKEMDIYDKAISVFDVNRHGFWCDTYPSIMENYICSIELNK